MEDDVESCMVNAHVSGTSLLDFRHSNDYPHPAFDAWRGPFHAQVGKKSGSKFQSRKELSILVEAFSEVSISRKLDINRE